MTAYRPVDSKREEYRKYLERAGVMESLTRALVRLYQEQDKGIDAIEYVRNLLIENQPSQNSTEEELKAQIAQLVSENSLLKKRLSQYEEIPPLMSVATPTITHPTQPADHGSVNSGHSKVSALPRNSQSAEKLSDRPSGPAQKK